MASDNHDLSPYEVARLERIKRNEERLRSLGFSQPPAVKPIQKVKVTPRKRRKQTPSLPTRSSKRLKELNNGAIQENTTDTDSGGENGKQSISEEKVNYSTIPQEPDQLDDNEFQVFVILRAWRLRRKNELEVEPYKICQNRTLCELIRRRRNDIGFASRQKAQGDKKQINEENNEEVAAERDLLSVWGIGPSKAEKGGFGWEMLDVLDSEENVKLLDKSRDDPSVHDSIDE